MRLTTLDLTGFRNISGAAIEFGDGVNVLCGENAQGKTNIIEAISLFSTTKSFRGATDREMLLYGGDTASLHAEFECDGRRQNSDIRLFSGKNKEMFLNGVKVSSKELMGKLNSVLFYPEQLSLIKNGPDGRRRFLDISVCQLRPVYYTLLSRYTRVLMQRNSLLKAGTKPALDLWDERLAKLSFLITQTRMNYLTRLEARSKELLSEISGGTETLELRYLPSCPSQTEQDVLTRIISLRERDCDLGFTTAGAHKDDFETYINGKNVKIYGSQGQQRSCVMAFKLAEADISGEVYGEYPLILLDDVFSELDAARRAYITSKILGRQVIITSCDPLPALPGARVMTVKGGNVSVSE